LSLRPLGVYRLPYIPTTPATVTSESQATSEVGNLSEDRFDESGEGIYSADVQNDKIPLPSALSEVKPAYVLEESGHGSPTLNSPVNTTPAATPPPPTATQTTRSGRHVHFPARFTT
jgi:hypothetical protein